MTITGKPTPLTALQQGMLFHAISNPGRGVDIEQIAFDLQESLDPEKFEASWRHGLSASSAMCARFRWRDSPEPVQIFDSEAAVTFTTLDWSGLDTTDQRKRIDSFADDDRLTDFDLQDGPLHRVCVVDLGDDRWWGMWSFHHILCDGRSFPLILADVFNHYDAGTEALVRPSFDQFVSDLRQVNQRQSSEAERFWSQNLAGLEPVNPLTIGVDSPTLEAPYRGVVELELDENQTVSLRDLAKVMDVTLNNIVQTAWAVLLHRYLGTSDITFGSTRACRHVAPASADTIGLLINTVPFRVNVDRGDSVATLTASIRDHHRALRQVETTPLPDIRRWSGLAAGQELFETLLMFDEASLGARLGHLGDHRSFVYQGQTNFPLTALVYGDTQMMIRLEHDLDRIASGPAERMAVQMKTILADLAQQAQTSGTSPVGELTYLATADHDRISGYNDTAVDYNLNQSLVTLLDAQVDLTPDAPAVTFGDTTLSYREFAARSNQVANYLVGRGVGPEITVGVHAHRSIEMLAAIHGIVRAGGSYLPLDPSFPADRLGFMLDDAGATLMLAGGGAIPEPGLVSAEVVDLDAGDSPVWSQPETSPGIDPEPDSAAYVLFTSGSTGRPKGAVNEHRGIVNRLIWMQEAFALDETDVVLQKTPITFDVSVWELFWPLQTGARLVLAQPDAHRDPKQLVEVIVNESVTTLHFVPSMLALFVEEPTIDRIESIRRVICSGEALSRDLQDRAFARMTTEIHNLYGPTEAAIDVTWWPCDPDSPLTTVPIGAAIANTQIYVVDSELRLVPPGAIGEILIAGVQVARGYLNRPELNAERFVVDGGSPDIDGRFYRTGDLGRHREDGIVEYHGRTDHQVKIRGLRVELGEIEAVLASHPAVSNCVVVDHRDPVGTKLVAYFTLEAMAETSAEDLEASLRDHLSESLADYMVPSAFTELDDLPLGSSGKIDRKALPAPNFGSTASAAPPKEGAEAQIANIWIELLGHSRIDREITFFDAGGDSLMVITLAGRLASEFGREVPVVDLIDAASVSAQAGLVTADQASAAPDTRLNDVAETVAARRNAARRRRRPRH